MDPLTKDEKEAELHNLIRKNEVVEQFRSILKKYPSLVNARGHNNNTLLMRAAIFGKVEIVRLLLEKGADTELKNKAGFTALMAAALEHQLEIVRMLIEAGAAKGTKDKEGNTALDYAKEGESDNKEEVLQLLKLTSPATSPATSSAKTGCRGHTCSIMGGKRQRRRGKTRRLKLSHKARRI